MAICALSSPPVIRIPAHVLELLFKLCSIENTFHCFLRGLSKLICPGNLFVYGAECVVCVKYILFILPGLYFAVLFIVHYPPGKLKCCLMCFAVSVSLYLHMPFPLSSPHL